MCGVILDMAFNFYDALLQMLSMCDSNVILLSKKHTQKFLTRTVSDLFVFYHDACFCARATNKMILIWVSFHLVVIKPFEECV